MHVIATAGHVDHGKSTLVRALTGIEPDRWDEEHRRGLTIDLGYAWTELDTGEQLAFVDVPGHERFIGNMLAGLGPVPAVMFVVAADEGWRQQSAEHLAAVDALGVRARVARRDACATGRTPGRPWPRPSSSSARARSARWRQWRSRRARGRGWMTCALRWAAWSRRLPAPRTDGRLRLWVDRSFSIKGSGTVVTGTLAEGRLSAGDAVELRGRSVGVRGLQSLERAVPSAAAVCRVAVNLRGLAVDDITRGDVLLTPGCVAAHGDARRTRARASLPTSCRPSSWCTSARRLSVLGLGRWVGATLGSPCGGDSRSWPATG